MAAWRVIQRATVVLQQARNSPRRVVRREGGGGKSNNGQNRDAAAVEKHRVPCGPRGCCVRRELDLARLREKLKSRSTS